MNSLEIYKNAIRLRDLARDGKSNQTPVMAWAAVARECANAERAFRDERGGKVYGRADLAFLDSISRVNWFARAQVETLARAA